MRRLEPVAPVWDKATTQNLSLQARIDGEFGSRSTKWGLFRRSLNNAGINGLFLRAVGKNGARLTPKVSSLTKHAICTFYVDQFNTDRKIVKPAVHHSCMRLFRDVAVMPDGVVARFLIGQPTIFERRP